MSPCHRHEEIANSTGAEATAAEVEAWKAESQRAKQAAAAAEARAEEAEARATAAAQEADSLRVAAAAGGASVDLERRCKEVTLNLVCCSSIVVQSIWHWRLGPRQRHRFSDSVHGGSSGWQGMSTTRTLQVQRCDTIFSWLPRSPQNDVCVA